jgi:type III secretion system FlhB-like substrate exporter
MTRRRMLHAVKTATVVITNPTHFAVALTYRRGEMAAPMVVAKGQDLMAARIRKVAAQHGVPTVENVTLARALYSADGQMLDEVYDYGSFKQSRMFAAGVTCGDCHEPHAAKLRAPAADSATAHALANSSPAHHATLRLQVRLLSPLRPAPAGGSETPLPAPAQEPAENRKSRTAPQARAQRSASASA